MRWQRKARILRTIERLPRALGDPFHYRLQRHCGGLRTPSAPEYIDAAARLQGLAARHGRSFEGARVFEVGAGWSLALAVALYLAGAKEVWSVDINRLAREQLVLRELQAFRSEAARVEECFGNDARERLQKLSTVGSLADLQHVAGIRYEAPLDAANVDAPAGCIDFHVSRSVFEHVPADALRALLREAGRLTGPEGLILHIVDLSDHFSHDDPTIRATNFLRYSEAEWQRLAGKRFAYVNRLRAPELLALFDDAGLAVLTADTFVDPTALEELSSGFPVAERFRRFDAETNATRVVHVAARRKD